MQIAGRHAVQSFKLLQAASVSLLKPGAVLNGRVVDLPAPNLARIAIGRAVLDISTSLPLERGASLKLLVEEQGGQTRLRLLEAETPGKAAIGQGDSVKPVPQLITQAALSKVLSHEFVRLLAGQDGAASLFANLNHLNATQVSALPPSVQEAVAQLLGFRLPVNRGGVTGSQVQNAFAKSGLFHDTGAASLTQAANNPQNLKSGLLSLRAALLNWVGAPAPQTRRSSVDRAPPPLRGAQPLGQAAASYTLAAGEEPETIARILLAQTEAALARVRLSQLASVNSPVKTADGQAEPGPKEWTFEIPLALGQETAIVQLRISGDGGAEIENTPDQWRVRFSMVLAKSGEVFADISMRGSDMNVRIWAEREDTLSKVRAAAGELQKALREDGISVNKISFRLGRPATSKATAGRIMDSTS